MTRLMALLDRLSNWRIIGVFLLLYALVFGSIVMTLLELTMLTGGIGILDFDRGYSLERVHEVFGSYGEAGFSLYGRIQFLDLFNPAIYALLFACFNTLLWEGRIRVWTIYLSLAARLLDYAENLTLFLLSASFPNISTQLVALSSTLSIIKNLALFGAVCAILIGLVLWMRKRISSQRD